MAINGLEVTDVIVFPVKNTKLNGHLRAFAKIVFNDQFIISGIRIVQGKNGPFISFPQENNNKPDGKRYDICFPVTAELRAYISDQVLSQYSLSVDLATA